MKKTLKSISMLAAAFVALAAVSCTKEGTPSAEQENGISTITLSIEQPTTEDATKTALGEKSGDYYPVNWSADDAIAVSEQAGSTFAKYTLSTGSGSTTGTFSTTETAPSGAAYAYYPYANVTGVSTQTYTVTIPDEQQYVAGSFGNGAMPMYASASSASELHSMTPLMSVLKISLTGSCNVKSILLQSASVNLSGAATVDMASGTVSIAEATGKKYVLLTCGTAVPLSSTATTFHIVVPATADKVTDFTVTIKDDKGYLMQKKLSTSEKFTAKTIKNVSTALPVTPSVLLPGKFTVSSTGKQVQFTTGNLYWNGSDYAFETEQTGYDKGTYDETNETTYYTPSHVSHFYCTNSADYANGVKPYAESHETLTHTSSDKLWCSEGNLLLFNNQSGLYVLTEDECCYLLNYDPSLNGGNGDFKTDGNVRQGKFKNGVTVNGNAGCLVIAPDDYSSTIADSYDAAAWAIAESDGLVCLPAAGTRGSSELCFGMFNMYCTADVVKSGGFYTYYCLSFWPPYFLSPDGQGEWDGAFNIRLVSTVVPK